MKKYHLLFLVTILFSTSTVFSQDIKSVKEQRRQAAKVDTVYTLEERSNMGVWLNQRVNEMSLTDEVREEYDAIVFSRIFEMSRLNDKDKHYTDQEIQDKFDEVVDNMNADVKKILTTEQYINHLENFAEIERSVYKKFDWKD